MRDIAFDSSAGLMDGATAGLIDNAIKVVNQPSLTIEPSNIFI